jgi:hypothetical protein
VADLGPGIGLADIIAQFRKDTQTLLSIIIGRQILKLLVKEQAETDQRPRFTAPEADLARYMQPLE